MIRVKDLIETIENWKKEACEKIDVVQKEQGKIRVTRYAGIGREQWQFNKEIDIYEDSIEKVTGFLQQELASNLRD